LQEFEKYLEPKTKRSTPLDPNFQNLFINAEDDSSYNTTFPYRSAVESLMYLATGTRADIITAVGIVSRFLEKPKDVHVEMVKRIFYYLRSNYNMELKYRTGSELKLKAYLDSSWANCEDFAFISGFAFLLGDSIISWSS